MNNLDLKMRFVICSLDNRVFSNLKSDVHANIMHLVWNTTYSNMYSDIASKIIVSIINDLRDRN